MAILWKTVCLTHNFNNSLRKFSLPNIQSVLHYKFEQLIVDFATSRHATGYNAVRHCKHGHRRFIVNSIVTI